MNGLTARTFRLVPDYQTLRYVYWGTFVCSHPISSDKVGGVVACGEQASPKQVKYGKLAVAEIYNHGFPVCNLIPKAHSEDNKRHLSARQ